MPNKDYISKIYSALSDNLEGFDKSPQEFETAMQDSAYAKKAYAALKENLTGFDKDESTFLSSVYGEPTTTVKKKDTPIIGSANGLQSPTPNTKTGASVSPLQQTGVNDRLSQISFGGGKYQPIEYSKEDKVDAFKKAYKANPLSPTISDEDLHKIAEKSVDKSPYIANEVTHKVKQKESWDNFIANAPAQEIIDKRKELVQQNPDNIDEISQSRLGKTADYLDGISKGNNVGNEDAVYLKSVAPKAFNELIPEGQDLQTSINSNRQKYQQQQAQEAVAYSENQRNYLINKGVVDPNTSIDISDGVVVGDISKKQNDEKQVALNQLEKQYPKKVQRDEMGRTIETFRDPEYYKQVAEINNKYNAINSSLGAVHATAIAIKSKDDIIANKKSISDVGEESLKIQNPETYNLYVAGLKQSDKTKASITKLGIEALRQTGIPELVQKANAEESIFYEKFPKELEDDTIKRLSQEYFKQTGLNYSFNQQNVDISVLDKFANNLPEQNKKFYFDNIRKQAIDDTKKWGDMTPSIDVPRVKLMNPNGIGNALVNEFARTTEASGRAILGVVDLALMANGQQPKFRTTEKVANEILSGVDVHDQQALDSEQAKQTIQYLNEKAKKEPLTYSEINAYHDAQSIDNSIPTGYNFATKSAGTLGMVASIAMQSYLLGGGAGLISEGLGGATIAGLTALQESGASAVEVAKYINTLKNIQGTSGALTMGLTMADDQYKRAVELMPNEGQGAQRAIYTGLMTAAWAMASRVMPLEKVFSKLTPDVEQQFVELAQQLSEKKVSEELAKTSLQKIMENAGLWATNMATNTAKITGEMGAIETVKQYGAESWANKNWNPEAGNEAIKHVLTTTPLDMLVVNAIGGIGAINNKSVSIDNIGALGNKEVGDRYIEVVNAQKEAGSISPEDAANRIKLTATLQQIQKDDIPKVMAIKKLNEREQNLYKVLLLNEKILNKEIEETKDKVLTKRYEDAISESEKKREKIIGQEYVVTPDYNIQTTQEANDIIKVNAESPQTEGVHYPNPNAEVGSGNITENQNSTDATTETAPKVDEITVGEMVDKVGTYKGEKGRFYQDGQTVVFKVDGQNKEYELGNISEVANTPISSFSIGHEESVVNINDAGNVIVRGEEYENNYSDPIQAINRDKDGSVVSVNLETPDGKKRTFRGNIAEDIAYQIHLKEITKDNETRTEFEQFINEGEASKEMDNAGISEVATTTTVEDNGTVPREKIEPKTVAEFVDRISKGERMTTPEELQFYENNKEEIEKALAEKSKAEPTPTNSNEPSSKVSSGEEGVAYTAEVGGRKSKGIYLADEDVAKSYGEDGSPIVKYKYKLKNPLVIEKDGDFDVVNKLIDDYLKENPDAKFHPDITDHVNKELEKLGYDGLIIKKESLDTEKGYNEIGGTYGEPQIVVFDRKNISVEQYSSTQEVKPNEPIVEQPKQKTNFTFEPSTKTNGNPEIIIKDGDNEVGYLRTAKQGDDILQTFQVKVDPKYWKQGAAKEAYIQLAKNNPDKTIRSSGQITPDSQGIWESLVRDGIAEKVGENKYEIKPQKNEYANKNTENAGQIQEVRKGENGQGNQSDASENSRPKTPAQFVKAAGEMNLTGQIEGQVMQAMLGVKLQRNVLYELFGSGGSANGKDARMLRAGKRFVGKPISGELKNKDAFLNSKAGEAGKKYESIDAIAHDIWENLGGLNNETIKEDEIKKIVEDTIMAFDSPSEIAEHIYDNFIDSEKGADKALNDYMMSQLPDGVDPKTGQWIAGYGEAVNAIDAMSDAELERLMNDEEAFLNSYEYTGGNNKPPVSNDNVGGEGDENSGKKDLKEMALNIPNNNVLNEYASKGTIERYHGETPLNDQSIVEQELRPALEHGENMVSKAKEIFGDEYIDKTLNFIESSKIPVQSKALMYISLENDLARQKEADPNNLDIQKKQDLVRSKSQAFLREASLAINFGKLRKIGLVGYDISKVTDDFFSRNELEDKKKVEKTIQADAKTINDEAEKSEQERLDIEQRINEAVDAEIEKIHQKLPTERRKKADKAIEALDNFQKKLRNKSYDATIGVPIAIIDGGITVIKRAIKAGVSIADAIDLGIQHIKDKYGKTWDKEGEFRSDMIAGFRDEGIKKEASGTPNKIIKDALIDAGYGREVTVNTKDGKEKRNILDWRKLAGEEGSIDKMKTTVEKVLEKQGYTEKEISDIQKDLEDQYNELRAKVIESSINELNKRNQKSITPEQRSAARKLSELYNYGLFEKDPAKYDVLLAKAIGIDRLSPERFQRAHDLGVALEKMYSTKFNGVKLNDIQLKTAIQQVEEAMRVLLHDESQQHGSTSLKIADIVRTFFDANQRMVLNNLKQTVENPLSGMEQSIISGVDRWLDNSSTPELKAQKRELAKAVYKDMVLHGSVGYGDVNNAFTNRGNLDAYINKMSDNQLFHAVASTVIGKTSLDAVDSMYKSKLTELKFTHNLIKILSKDRLVDGKLVNGMSKENAVRYVSEKLTGQSFDDAKKTARQIISNVNSGDKKIVGDSEEAVTRLANDIVKAALINGNVITSDQVSAAYNSAYKSAGRNLGHVANNVISKGTESVSAGIEKRINDAIKDKEYKKAALLTYQSIFYRNILNPFVGGGTNWVVLKFEKNGLGLVSGLYNGGRTKLDLTTDAGLKNMEKALFEEARDRDAFMRGAIGGATSLLMAALFYGVTNDDEYRKWRNKNQWASRYLDLVTPEETLAAMAAKNDRLGYYAGTLVNKNDAFDKSTKVISAITMLDKEKSKDIKMTTKEKVLGKVGEVVGGVLGTPVPWRAVRDGQNIWLGAKGEQPYKISSQPPKGFFEGIFRGGFVDYIKNNPAKK